MCGIFGGSGKLDDGVLTALGCQSESRGTDSSGLAWIDHLKKTILVSKVVERGSVAFPLLLQDDVQRASKSKCMIGHTRMASTGKVNIKNAHPFYMDDVVFAHNGVISNYAKFSKGECDSMCLVIGIKEKNFEHFEGSIGLVWIENDKLHAYRKGSPLFRGKKDNAVYLASEKSMLARVGCKRIKELTEGMIYVFEKTEIVETVKVKENNYGYKMGSQEKWWKEYEKDPNSWEWDVKPYLEELKNKKEEEELKDAGLDYYVDKYGKKCYGKVPKEIKHLNEEYATLLKEKPIHALTDAEWEKYGGV